MRELNEVSLTAVAHGIRHTIHSPDIQSEDEARDRVSSLINSSPWGEEAQTFRQLELAESYFQNRSDVSISDALAEASERQVQRLNTTASTIHSFDGMRCLNVFDAAVFWIAIAPDPADECLSYLLGFSTRRGTTTLEREHRPAWAPGPRRMLR